MNKIPTVVIVGRPNVGKSTLFNRLSVDIKSLTFDYVGVTRDIIKDTIYWKDCCFELIDTGGFSLRKIDDPVAEQARLRVLSLLEKADLILFIVDGNVGLLAEDRDIARLLYQLKKQVLLAINKIDSKTAQENLYEFQKLGFKESFPLSAQHGIGIAELLDAIVVQLPKKEIVLEEPEARFNVVLLGKPNVGKSSLMNVLLKQERSLVSEIPGTTREAIHEKIRFYQEDIQLVDTPGVRRKRSIKEPLERLMVKSTLQAVKNADIVLLLVDASEGTLSDQELKLAFYVFEDQKKALIILFNKQDLVNEEMRERLKYDLAPYDHFTKKVEHLDISCKTGKNVGKLLSVVQNLWERYSQIISDDELTILFKDVLYKKPLYHKTNLLRLFRVKQVKTAPMMLVMIVNQPKWFGPSQVTFFENVLRRNYKLVGVPIAFVTRSR